MSDERDPAIERMFAAADRELGGEEFVARVMTRASALRTQRLVLGVAVCLALAVPATWFVAGPFNDALLWFMRLISQPIVGGDGLASRSVLPMNSVAGAVVLGLLTLRSLARKLMLTRG